MGKKFTASNELKHFNAHKMCAVEVDTNGKQEIVELAIIPMNNFNVDKSIMPYSVKFRVKERGNLSAKAFEECQKYGLDPFTAADVFDAWYKKLKLPPKKRIMPMSYDWAGKRVYIQEWLMYFQDKPIYDVYFNEMARDIVVIMGYMADICAVSNAIIPFPEYGFTKMCTRLGLPYLESKTTLDRAYRMVEVYDLLTNWYLPMGVDLPLRYPLPVNYEDRDEYDQFDLAGE